MISSIARVLLRYASCGLGTLAACALRERHRVSVDALGVVGGAHYREAIRSRSNAEMISKFEGALMELEESAYWMELLVGLELVTQHKLASLRNEADELTAIFVAAVNKLKRRR